MADDDRLTRSTRIRREPPPLVEVTVVERVELTPRMMRITFEGDAVSDLTIEQPAMSIRLLVPTPGTDVLVIPTWNGNEFLLPDGSRPALRTFTPLTAGADGVGDRIAVEIVRHPGGAVSEWAEAAAVGAPAALSGPGRGFDYPAGVTDVIVLADETALPAARQVAEMAPADVGAQLHVEVVHRDARHDLVLDHRHRVEWHVTPDGAVPGREIAAVARSFDALDPGVHIWAAGEASAMHSIRNHLFDTLGVDRKRATVRGYWKPPR